MTAGVIFWVAVAAVAPLWLLLVLRPDSFATRVTAHAPLPYLLVSAVYVIAVIWVGARPDDLTSWSGVRDLYRSEVMVLASWLHFIVIDLFVGAWMARDAVRLGLARWQVRLCLVLTFSMAPVGLSAYLLLRGRNARVSSLHELPAARS